MALGAISTDAAALALGRLNVQSALGEPLRAEIEVTEITAAEADGLKVRIAPADAFNAAGVPYNPALADVRTNLQRRADGRYVVRLSSNRMLSEPFIDLLLEATWNSGRVVRDYTVLLDPPKSRTATAAAPIAPTAPQITAPSQRTAPAVVQAPARRERPAPAAAAPAAPTQAEGAVRTGSGDQQVTVQPGDTASKIAGAYKSADVSLDQMLVALLRANPDAFIGRNVNRIKAGAVLDVPSAAQASSVPAPEARSTVTAQSRDFGEYRRRLAENAPASRVAEADRQASGKLQANVEDRNAASAAADKLKITQGGAVAGRQTEEQLAKARQAQDSSTRVAELSKNISELNKLQAASGSPTTAGSTAPAAAPAPVAPAPSAAAPAATPPTTGSTPAPTAAAPAASPAIPALPAAVAPAATAAAEAPATPPAATTTPPEAAASAAAPAAVPAPAAAAKPKPPAPSPAPVERSFFDELLDNPIMLGAAALIALLVGFLLYRVLGRKRRDANDSVFLESRIPKDSFFGASGGESVDTKNRGNSVVSSLSYSPSQLDAGDVDPVAEADVYLAYGRDLQAEEILREALRVNPERTAIHLKLLEIHAKRRDLRAYEALASDVHKLTGGTGADWNRVVELGKDLDPGNPLYESGGRGVSAAETAAFAGTLAAATATPPAPAPATSPVAKPVVAAAPPPAFVPSVAPLDFDLDLSKPPAPAPASAAAAPVNATLPAARNGAENAAAPSLVKYSAPLASSAKIDLNNDFDTAPGALQPNTARAPLNTEEEFTQPATLRAGLPGDSGFIEFDMSSMAGLSGRSPADTERGRLEPVEDSGESPHAIKLSLARELKALGDVEGARSLVEEVASEGSGEVKAEAKQLLGQLR
ncbi:MULTISPECIES: FimV/HubP family polar landmark protein [unclassified Variovorax]|uniref:FimV/HubP family polar landmark protein n=1 Tax=unclassified Variovorax TaxID=663243 RepID=UPI003F519588